MKSVWRHLSFANAMSVLAVFIALSSGAYAVHVSRHSVGAPQLKKNAVKEKKIANRAVTQNKLGDGSVNGAKVADGSLGLADVNVSLHQICAAGTVYLQGAWIEDHAANSRHSLRRCASRLRSERAAAERRGARLAQQAPGDLVDPVSSGPPSVSADDGSLPVATVSDAGVLGINADSNSGFAPFRCVFEPTG